MDVIGNDAEAAEVLAEWHQFWLDHGEPHPSSNLYLNMTRAFFYMRGFEQGIKTAVRLQDDEDMTAVV